MEGRLLTDALMITLRVVVCFFPPFPKYTALGVRISHGREEATAGSLRGVHDLITGGDVLEALTSGFITVMCKRRNGPGGTRWLNNEPWFRSQAVPFQYITRASRDDRCTHSAASH